MKANYPAHVGAFCEAFPAAHLVQCGYKGKERAAGPGWTTHPADHSAMRRHAETAWVGLIPASIGLTVVDVDEGNPLALAVALRSGISRGRWVKRNRGTAARLRAASCGVGRAWLTKKHPPAHDCRRAARGS